MNSLRQGFTFLEMSVVIVIIAVITGMGLMATLGSMESTKQIATEKRLDAIESALLSFRLANNRLPCPGSQILTSSDNNYGKEAAATYPTTSLAATSYNCISGTPHANFYWGAATNSSGAQFAEGAVPVRTLGLPDEYLYDGWGRRFAYAVDAYVTIANAFSTMRPTDNCILTVQDSSHTPRTNGAVYVLFSYGADGHGGFINSTARQNSGSTDPDELLNCHCDSNAANNGTMSYAP